MKIIEESVQMIHIGPDTRLTPVTINYALQRAASNFMYAKFYTGKYFIQVNFMKDHTINVSSNIRNAQFQSDLYRYNSIGWTISLAKTFVYTWMQKSRRVLY